MKYFGFISLSFCMLTANAQHKISGTVMYGDTPVPYVTVALLRPDSSAITGVITGNDGKFIIENVAVGDYILQMSFIGYNKEYRKVNVPTQSDLGEINLTESVNKLQEVVVSANRPLIENQVDRYIVNVSDNIQSAGRDALDILRNTPGVLVNQNGDISVMGNSAQIWIDGRSSRMSGGQLQDFLKSMQGGEINRIEVITNPSSRYDAAGSGGIIDIRTKKGMQFGVNGTVSIGYQQGRTDRENAAASMNWRHQKFNLYGNYSFSRSNWWQEVTNQNVWQTPDGEITYDQNTLFKNLKADIRNSLRAGIDYFINPQNILGVIVNTYYTDEGITSIKGFTDISPSDDNGVSYATSDNPRTEVNDGIRVNMNYQSVFAEKAGQQLNFDVDYARFTSKPFQQNTDIFFDAKNGVMIGDIQQSRRTNLQNINVYAAKFDFTQQPLWKNALMEIGAKFAQTTTDNDLQSEKVINDVWKENFNMSNRFVYTEQISAAYINISQKLGEKINIQGGLRGEYTYSKGKQLTTDTVNKRSYLDLFPTFFVNYQPSEKHNLGLSYSRRLTRPNYNHLNPFELIIDAYSYQNGNPNLMPEYTHNLQLSHTFAKNLMTRIGYSHTAGMITYMPFKEAATQRFGAIPQNFGKSQNITAMVTYCQKIAKILTANMTVQGDYKTNTSHEASGEFVNKGFTFYIQQNNNITITPTLSADISGWFRSKERSGYDVQQPQGSVSVGLRQKMLKNKMTLSLIGNYTTTYKSTTKYENVNNTFSYRGDSPSVKLTIRYDFGSATVKAARNKQSGIEDETSRAGK